MARSTNSAEQEYRRTMNQNPMERWSPVSFDEYHARRRMGGSMPGVNGAPTGAPIPYHDYDEQQYKRNMNSFERAERERMDKSDRRRSYMPPQQMMRESPTFARQQQHEDWRMEHGGRSSDDADSLWSNELEKKPLVGTLQTVETKKLGQYKYEFVDHRDNSILYMQIIPFAEKCFVRFNENGDMIDLLKMKAIEKVCTKKDLTTTQSTCSAAPDMVTLHFENSQEVLEIDCSSRLFSEAMTALGPHIESFLKKGRADVDNLLDSYNTQDCPKNPVHVRSKRHEREGSYTMGSPSMRSPIEVASSSTTKKNSQSYNHRSKDTDAVTEPVSKPKKKSSFWRRLRGAD